MDPSAALAPDVIPPGTVLGRYEIRRLIGRGGMGSVYEGLHRDLKKRVAIKTLLPSLAANPDSKIRFLREGEAASRIRHPHVVDVTDVGTDGNVIYLVMEYLEGEDLGKVIGRQGALTVVETADIMLPVIAAIATAHDQGVVHRDLKPENIFLSRGPMGGLQPKVLDFGISKVSGDLRTMALTGTGATFGTTFYLPPEQLRGARQADARSDQYALGTIIYECVTGQRAFEGDNLYAVLKDIAESRYRPAASLRPDLPASVDDIINRSMYLDPAGRFETARHLGAALLEFATPGVRMMWTPFFSTLPVGTGSGPIASRGFNPNAATPPPRVYTPPPSGPVEPLSSRDLLSATPPPSAGARAGVTTDPPRASAGNTRILPSGNTPSPDSGRRPRPRVESTSTFSHATGESSSFIDVPPPPRKSRLPLYVGLGVVAAVVGVFLVIRPDLPTQTTHPVPTVAPEPRNYRVEIVTEPSTATIELDGQLVGTGAFARKLPVDGAEHEIVAKARGYRNATLRFTDSAPARDLTLEPIAPPPEPRPPVVIAPPPEKAEPTGKSGNTGKSGKTDKSGKSGKMDKSGKSGKAGDPRHDNPPPATDPPTGKSTPARPQTPKGNKGDGLLPNNAPIVE